MVTRRTKKPITVTLDKDQKQRLDDLVESWSMEQKKRVLQNLNKYSPSIIFHNRSKKEKIRDFFFGKQKKEKREKKIGHLANPDIFSSPKARYLITGEEDSKKAMHRIFDYEISKDDRIYLTHTLKVETDDVYIPQELIDEFSIAHRKHHQDLLVSGKESTKAPFYLILGPTGSGKTKTINRAIEIALFNQELVIKDKISDDLEEIIRQHPIMSRISLSYVAPELAAKIKEEKRRKRIEILSKIPFLKNFYREERAELLDDEEEGFSMNIDIEQINPSNVQTKWYGETGNNIEKSFGSKSATSIRILEEAHALLSEHESHGAQVQEDLLVASFNIILDEIQDGDRNCMVVAITRKGEDFYPDIYRRFQENGRIIDMAQYWKNTKSVGELIKREVLMQDIAMPEEKKLEELSSKVLQIFEYRGLDVTPAYVRLLIGSIAKLKGEITLDHLDDGILVREAFVDVARNRYPEMFKKTYNKLLRGVPWEDYVGDVKEEFQRLANQCLYHNLGTEKGAVLAGPPGTGKTFLVSTYLSRHTEISDVTVKAEDLQDEKNPVDGPVKNLANVFDIAKMCAPTVMFFDEGDSVARERQGNIHDRITNKLLNAIDGGSELKGTYVVLTTNNPQYLAEAATRTKRLKVMAITGKLHERDIYKMLNNYFSKEDISSKLTNQRIYSIARQICATPADYSGFFETIINFKKEEREVLKSSIDNSNLNEFIISNYKVFLGIIESLDFPANFIQEAKKEVSFLIDSREELMEKVKSFVDEDQYPITLAHLERARLDRIQTPRLQQKISLDYYLESELSSEPQIGFVIGAGADETSGLLVPIQSSLPYDEDHSDGKIVVTGAVSINAPQAAELNAAVEMMKQSSKEALTLVLNYLDSLVPEKDVKRIIGTHLKNRHFHHQFLTAGYKSGGPSAGMALAISTLSTILEIPVRHDFAITGAPWSGGKNKKDIGSAVIIGGTHNKAQVVLSYLDRMYVPRQNLKEIDSITLESYWRNGKDVVGYDSFSSIVGEVFCIDSDLTEKLFEKRIEAKRLELVAADDAQDMFAEVDELSKEIRRNAEDFIRRRVGCIENYLRSDDKDEFSSLHSIFEKYQESA